jgi:hypothetical protein
MSGGVVSYVTPQVNMPYVAMQAALGKRSRGVRLNAPTIPILNPLPQNIILIHGMDMEPVRVDAQEISDGVEELRQRLASEPAPLNRLVCAA